MKIKVGTCIALAALLGTGTASAIEFVPSVIADDGPEQAQAAEQAFAAEDYSSAYQIYLEKLAPRGDKYAQYMIGYMHLNGLGQEPDKVRGTAWLMLAAERNQEQFVEIRDAALQQLNADQRTEAQEEYDNLSVTYGDCKVTRTMLQEERDLLAPVTGTRLTTNVALPVTRRLKSGAILRAEDRALIREVRKKRKAFLREHCE